jgi:DNA-binding transcriptional MocR family regulator
LSDQFTSASDRLVGALADDIIEGKLDTGSRLPAHRDLAYRLGIGIGTVTKAYGILERRGLVRTVKGSGTFVALSQSRKGPVIDLSRNAPPATMTERLLARTLMAIAKRVDAGMFNSYPPPGGHDEHRRLLARWFANIGMQADPQRLLLTSGAHHAISVALSVSCGQGGVLFTEMHTYPGVIALARHHGIHLVGVGMDEEGMLPDALEHALMANRSSAAALYVTPTMQNPTMATMSRARRAALVALCRRHDIAIIEDDVYNLGLDPQRLPLAMLAPERTFYANSMSKTLNPTLRIGALIAPETKLAQTQAILQATAVMVSPLSCEIMEQWLIDGTADMVSSAIQDESKRRMTLAKSLLGELVRIPDDPGYHLWIPMPRSEAERLYQAAAAFGVLVTPPSTTEVCPGTTNSGIRLCLGAPAISDLSSALATIGRLLREDRATAVRPAMAS